MQQPGAAGAGRIDDSSSCHARSKLITSGKSLVRVFGSRIQPLSGGDGEIVAVLVIVDKEPIMDSEIIMK